MHNLKLSKQFTQKLLFWFYANARHMPWRDLVINPDPYHVWISEVMLQQTTVTAVIGYFHKWLKAFPSIKSLSNADEQAVLKQWQGLGYYNRARNLLLCSHVLVNEHKARLPTTYEELIKLPGFGSYTAAAVASIAFHRKIPLIDANVRRVMMRIIGIECQISTKHDKYILKQLDSLIPETKPGDFNQAMMELGALICKPKEPVCNRCPIRQHCYAYLAGIQEVIPTPRTKILKEIIAVVGIIRKKTKVLIQRRPNKGLLAGLWEFPGGKVDVSDKSLRDALKREIWEETGLTIDSTKKLGQVTHYYTQFKVRLNAYECFCRNMEKFKESEDSKFVMLEELKNYPMPSGSAKLLDKYIYNQKDDSSQPY